MTDKPTSSMKRRLNVVVAALMIAFIVYIVLTMVSVSITNSDEYQRLASSQQLKSTTITASRGTIYDANMQILAQSATVYTIYVDPVLLSRNLEEEDCKLTLDDVTAKLSALLETEQSAVEAKCLKDNRYQEIKKNVEKNTADEIRAYAKENSLSGIGATESSKRFYPENSLAASVIGHLHYDGYGVYGLESYYDDFLSGVDGKTLIATDNQGNEIPYEYKQSYDAQSGDSLVLNLDVTVQAALENALLSCVQDHNPAGRATGIVMNPKTGAIYAMASTYGYDLNNPAEISNPETAAAIAAMADGEDKTKAQGTAWSTQWKNKAISEIYFPGSVFKVITASSALEEQTISLKDTFDCGIVYKVADTSFHCWSRDHDHGIQTLYDAMMNSCNPAFIRIGQTLGSALFSKYYAAYGFTEQTGIDLPSEASSLFVSESRMGPVELASSSFGQTNKITAVEMITAYSAVVNGGYLVTPQVVDKIIDSNGNVVKDVEPIVKRQVISEETSAEMREVLQYVVDNAPSGNSYIKGYKIGGKSGTSQKLDTGRDNAYVGSYCAFAPADDPEVILLIVVDEPQNGKIYGSQVAAPYATEVLEAILPHLGIYPEYSDDELDEIPVSVKNTEYATVDEAKLTLEALGLKPVVVGSGSSVVKQVPSTGSTKRGSSVILYTEENSVEETATVPSLAGLTLEQAQEALENVGLNLLPSGSAAYTSGATAGYDQSIASGTVVSKGTIVSVTFYSSTVTSQ